MDEFVRLHGAQLDALGIPEALHEGLKRRLEAVFGPDSSDDGNQGGGEVGEEHRHDDDHHHRTRGGAADAAEEGRLLDAVLDMLGEEEGGTVGPGGCLLVVPHLCSWDAQDHRGMWRELSRLSGSTLRRVRDSLRRLSSFPAGGPPEEEEEEDDDDSRKEEVLEDICRLGAWSAVILYRTTDSAGSPRVRAALPAPPYYPHVRFDSEADFSAKEADLTGPFPFRYHRPSARAGEGTAMIETSLAYASPGVTISAFSLPTVDAAPAAALPDPLARCVRYAALLSDARRREEIPACVRDRLEEHYRSFLDGAEDDRRRLEQRRGTPAAASSAPPPSTSDDASRRPLRVYTDSGDPIGLSRPDSGLTDPRFALVDRLDEADAVFSYRSLFAPAGPLREALDARQRQEPARPLLLNQFPYEGAFVQKDHLARELWRQYGAERRPDWAIESYDLDAQRAAFFARATALVDESDERGLPAPAWIVKPATGTQSRGHLVTRSLAHVCRLLDADGAGGTAKRTSRVAQRYIERPACYRGRKVDCRCVVIMTDASPGRPALYVHDRVFLRIARNPHDLSRPGALLDPETVLTATHLLRESDRSSPPGEPLPPLPPDAATIRGLEEAHGFRWSEDVLPRIHAMIRELFGGMTLAYPAMASNPGCRAVYGVDVMFEVLPDGGGVRPKLTEVTFCPANNATCDAYERDDDLYRSYLNDVFNCMFRGVASQNLTKLQ